jgi:hypothetical protein
MCNEPLLKERLVCVSASQQRAAALDEQWLWPEDVSCSDTMCVRLWWKGWVRVVRRVLVAVGLLMLLALAPLSATAASGASQTITGTVDIVSVSGSCPEPTVISGTNISSSASGVVDDSGAFNLSLDYDGPFPGQVTGDFAFIGAHSEAQLFFTGALRCVDAQSLTVSGQVWSGTMYDDATGQWYTINGAGRGNSISIVAGPNGFSVTFTGTAKLSMRPLER